jgi:uncharacterized membrane protein
VIPRALVVLAVGLLACGRESITSPHDSADVNEQNPIVVIIVPADRAETLLAGDTVTLTAAVFDKKARELTTGTIDWRSPMVVSVGPRSGLLKIPAAATEIVAVFKRPGFADVHGRATIGAKRFPGTVFVWTPGVSLIEVPSPEGAREVNAAAINDRGEVVGSVDYGDRTQAFIWSQQLGYRELSAPLPARSTFASAISETGTVVGSIAAASGRFTPFLWTVQNGMVEIDGGATPNSVTFADINAAGRVAGSRGGAAFVWSESAGFQDIGPNPSPEEILQPVGINDNDDVLLASNGKYQRNVDYGWGFPPDAALLTAGSRINVDCGECALSDMNNARVIVGNTLAPERNGFRWTRERGTEPLPSGPGFNSEAFGINESGVVAGAIWVREGFWRTNATIWRGNELVVLPNQWGARSTIALDINNVGQVLVIVR